MSKRSSYNLANRLKAVNRRKKARKGFRCQALAHKVELVRTHRAKG